MFYFTEYYKEYIHILCKNVTVQNRSTPDQFWTCRDVFGAPEQTLNKTMPDKDEAIKQDAQEDFLYSASFCTETNIC